MQRKFTKEEYLQFVEQTLGDMKELIRRKNADYTNGAGPFANFEISEDVGVDPIKGLVIRLLDKVQRLKSYCKQGELQVQGEGVEDIFKDFIGYSLIGLAMMQERVKTPPQPLKEPLPSWDLQGCVDERTGYIEPLTIQDLRPCWPLPQSGVNPVSPGQPPLGTSKL